MNFDVTKKKSMIILLLEFEFLVEILNLFFHLSFYIKYSKNKDDRYIKYIEKFEKKIKEKIFYKLGKKKYIFLIDKDKLLNNSFFYHIVL